MELEWFRLASNYKFETKVHEFCKNTQKRIWWEKKRVVDLYSHSAATAADYSSVEE
jgi:hypothetical protein